MDYTQTIDYLFKQLPMFQRVGASAYKADLKTTLKLDNYFNHPHKNYKTIHVAGTNGKGSVAHSVASVLQEAGYKTGLYTSPHYLDFRERIRINGISIDKDFVIEFVEKNKSFLFSLKPSFFEITAAMAFEYFAKQKVEIAVVEVGMGGRLDSTNIIKPILSIITNIGYDHIQFLGNTLKSIATEKAGIIKKDIPVVIGEKKVELKSVFSKKAQEVDAPIFFANHNFEITNFSHSIKNTLHVNINKHGKLAYNNLEFGLNGNYQILNIISVIQAINILQKMLIISEEHIYKGLKNVVGNTNIVGRWQNLGENPKIICDAGHNVDGISNVVSQLKNEKYNKLRIVFGTVNDKEIDEILKLLPQEAKYYFTKASVQRALNHNVLLNKSKKYMLIGNSFSTVSQAIEEALINSENDDLIFIGGSTFVVADALEFFNKKS